MANQITHEEMEAILYPRRFMSKEEVLLYTSSDRVTCLICDKSFKNLARHIGDAHGCDHKKYRDILNIPRTMNLMCKDLIDRMSAESKDRFDNKMPQDQKDFLLKSVHNPTGKAGEIVSTIAAEEKNKGAKSKGKNKGKVHGRTQGHCHDCGVEMEISTQRVNRTTKCKPCIHKRRNEQIAEYQARNKQKISEYQKEWYKKKKKEQPTVDSGGDK